MTLTLGMIGISSQRSGCAGSDQRQEKTTPRRGDCHRRRPRGPLGAGRGDNHGSGWVQPRAGDSHQRVGRSDRVPVGTHWCPRIRMGVQFPERRRLGRHPRLGGEWWWNTVTELSATTGGLVKVISGSRYEFNRSSAIASDGTRVWVADGGNSVNRAERDDGWPGQGDLGFEVQVQRAVGHRLGRHTRLGDELRQLHSHGVEGDDGRLVRAISGSSYQFNHPDAIASDGTHVWVGERVWPISHGIFRLTDGAEARARSVLAWAPSETGEAGS